MIQEEMAVIPKSIHTERVLENMDVFDFELTDDEMNKLKSIDTEKPLIGCSLKHKPI